MKKNRMTYEGVNTPCYIIEEDLLRDNLRLIRHVMDEAQVEIILAFKAFAQWKTFPIFREYINHTTASSLNEAKLAVEKFGSKAHAFFTAYSESEFYDVLEHCSHVTFNTLSQLERFKGMVETYNRSHAGNAVSCGLRINPEHSEIQVELYNPCAPGSRFGVMASQMPDELPGIVEGLHCHCHCESTSYELERTLERIDRKFGRWLPKIKWLNLGGGHLMTRKDYDVEHLISLLKSFKRAHPNLSLILEPGSAFAWQTGPLVASVLDIVENKGIRTAILDVSFTCHMPDCLEMPYQPEVRFAESLEPEAVKFASPGSHVYRLGGNSCLSGDYMGLWRFDHELQVGEKVIFEDMIHYTIVKTTMFNGVGHPSIAMLHSNGELEIYRKFTYEDYRDRMC